MLEPEVASLPKRVGLDQAVRSACFGDLTMGGSKSIFTKLVGKIVDIRSRATYNETRFSK